MKYLILVLFPLVSFAQKQYVVDSAGALNLGLMKVKFRDVTDTIYASDGSEVYLIESNFPNTSMPHTKIRVLTYQSPLSTKSTPAQRKQIADFIKSVLEPPNIPNAEKIDGEAATFSTGWRHGPTADSSWYQNTIAYSNVAGETATYAFTGTGIELYAETKPGHGTGTVTLLRGTEVIETKDVSFVSATTVIPAKIYEKKGLTSGTYTIRLTSVQNPVLLDFFNVYK